MSRGRMYAAALGLLFATVIVTEQRCAFAAQAAQPLDPAVLALPVYDLERLNAPKGTAQGTEKIRVGDSIDLRAAGFHAFPGLTVAPLSGGDGDLGEQGWAVEVGKSPDPAELRIMATPVKPGGLTLPPLAIVDANGKRVARTNTITVDVLSAIAADDPKPSEPVEERPPVGLPFPIWAVAALAIAALALFAAAIYGAVRFARWYRRHRARPAASVPPRPEDQVALEALRLLEQQALVAKGQFKKHYFTLSEIVKTYIGARYRIDALESTSREMIRALETGHAMPEAVIDRVESLFERLDLVKFTDHVPAEGEPAQLLEEARKIVLSTRRIPEIVPPGAIARGLDADDRDQTEARLS